jgi:hypothetical protein
MRYIVNHVETRRCTVTLPSLIRRQAPRNAKKANRPEQAGIDERRCTREEGSRLGWVALAFLTFDKRRSYSRRGSIPGDLERPPGVGEATPSGAERDGRKGGPARDDPRRGDRIAETQRGTRDSPNAPCGRRFWNIALRRRRARVSRWDGLGQQVEERVAWDRFTVQRQVESQRRR